MTRRNYVMIAAMLLLILALATAAMAATTTTNRSARSTTPSSSQTMSAYNYGNLQRCLAGVQLTTTQRQQINTIRQNSQRDMTNIRNNRNLTSTQRTQQLRTAQRNEINRIIAVLTPQQRTQFRSCIMTTTKPTAKPSKPGGAGAGMGQVVPGVTLTAQQRQQISSIRTREMREMQAVRQDTSLTAAERDTRLRDIRMRAHNDIMNVLTPTQRQQFDNWWKQRTGSTS